jgi:oligo-1,6-glucosidase
VASAKLLETMLLTLRGTPFIYQGDELGMTNYPFKGIDEYNDIEAKNGYKADVVTGKVSEAEYLENLRHMSRDNSRTPIQWDASANGGFTTGKPWLAVNPNYKEINAAAEVVDKQSIYNYTKAMIALRHLTPALVYGSYADLDPMNPSVFAYTRSLGIDRYLVVLNFSAEPVTYKIPGGLRPTQLLLTNLGSAEVDTSTLHLKPWEARVYQYIAAVSGRIPDGGNQITGEKSLLPDNGQ